MSQVIFEFASPASVGGSPLVAAGTSTNEEITSSGANQATTATARANSICVVHNNGTDAIWVNFGADAAIGTGHFMAPNTDRAFGALSAGQTGNVINDS